MAKRKTKASSEDLPEIDRVDVANLLSLIDEIETTANIYNSDVESYESDREEAATFNRSARESLKSIKARKKDLLADIQKLTRVLESLIANITADETPTEEDTEALDLAHGGGNRFDVERT